MNNLILNATSNNKTFHKYVFDTKESFKSEFLKILTKLNFKEDKIKNFWIRQALEQKETKTQPEIRMPVTPKISFFRNTFHTLENKNCHLELFIGNKKVFLIIRLKRDKKNTRENLINFLQESKWITPEEAENRRWKKEKTLQSLIPKTKKIIQKK
jgi:hypothetical protein